MGTVIKAGTSAGTLQGLQSFGLKDHMSEAHAVVREAHERAAMIARQAEARAAELFSEARRTGYEKGMAEGRAAGRREGHAAAHEDAFGRFSDELAQVTSALRKAVGVIDDREEELIERANRDLLSFALLIAARITKQTGMADRRVAAANASEAIRHVVGENDLVIRVHPDDAATLRDFAVDPAGDPSRKRRLRVVEDETVEPGGCKVESLMTQVDATLHTQLNRAADMLMGDTEGGRPWEESGSGVGEAES